MSGAPSAPCPPQQCSRVSLLHAMNASLRLQPVFAAASIQVQDPAAGPFGQAALQWTASSDKRGSHKQAPDAQPDIEAYIHADRIDDFLKGCEDAGGCQLTVHKKKGVGSSSMPADGVDMAPSPHVARQWDAIRTHNRYNCNFGPEDLRVPADAAVPSAPPKGERRKKTLHNQSKKVGCRWAVDIRTFVHTGLTGVAKLTLHGSHTGHSNRLRFSLSNACKELTAVMGVVGASAERTIAANAERLRLDFMREHPDVPHGEVRAAMTAEVLKNPGSAMARDFLLTPKDVQNLTSQAAECSGLSNTDTGRLVEEQVAASRAAGENAIFYYAPKTATTPFGIGIATMFMRRQCLEHGNALFVDATHGTNDLKFPLTTILAQDAHGHGLPVAFIITEGGAEDHLTPPLAAFNRSMRDPSIGGDSTYQPASVTMDGAWAQQNAFKAVFGVAFPVYLCVFHFLRAVIANMCQLIASRPIRQRIFREIQAILHCGRPGASVEATLATCRSMWAAVRQQYAGFPAGVLKFLDYFDSTWMSRPGQWVLALRVAYHGGQVTTALCEGFHWSIKKIDLPAAFGCGIRGRSLPKLVSMLLYKTEERYWLRDLRRRLGGEVNKSREDQLRAAIEKADSIPAAAIEILSHASGGHAIVASQSTPEISYTILSAGEDRGQCNCPQGLQGAFCKHRVAVLLQLGQLPFQIFERYGIDHGAAELPAPGSSSALAADSAAAPAVSAVADDAAGSEVAAMPAAGAPQRGRRALTAQDRFQDVMARLKCELALELPMSDWWGRAQRLLEPAINTLIAMRTSGALISNLSYGGSGSGLADADVNMSQSQRHGVAAAPVVRALVSNPSAATGFGAARLRAFFEPGRRRAAKRPPPAQQPSATSPERLPLQARQRNGATKTQQRSLAAMVNKKGVDGEAENQPLATAGVPQPVAPQPGDQAREAVLSQMSFSDLMQI